MHLSHSQPPSKKPHQTGDESGLDDLGKILNSKVSDYVLQSTLEEEAFKHAYEVRWTRMDQAPYSRPTIQQNVVAAMRSSHLCVADITPEYESIDSNKTFGKKSPSPSVMHEIGFAHGLDIPVFLVGESDTKNHLPANLSGSLVSEYGKELNKDDDEKFAKHLASTIVNHIKIQGNRMRMALEMHPTSLGV